jgi:hypothetical protein
MSEPSEYEIPTPPDGPFRVICLDCGHAPDDERIYTQLQRPEHMKTTCGACKSEHVSLVPFYVPADRQLNITATPTRPELGRLRYF